MEVRCNWSFRTCFTSSQSYLFFNTDQKQIKQHCLNLRSTLYDVLTKRISCHWEWKKRGCQSWNTKINFHSIQHHPKSFQYSSSGKFTCIQCTLNIDFLRENVFPFLLSDEWCPCWTCFVFYLLSFRFTLSVLLPTHSLFKTKYLKPLLSGHYSPEETN